MRGVVIKCFLAAACVVVGAFASYLALDMVSVFGEGMGVDARSQKLYARAHVVVHVFGTLSAILITVFRANGHKLHSNIAIVAMLTCGGYGIVNMIGFTSTSRVAVAEAKTAVNTAAERQYQAALAAKKAEIAWTRNTVVNEVNRKEKRRLEEALEKKEKELAEIRYTEAQRPWAGGGLRRFKSRYTEAQRPWAGGGLRRFKSGRLRRFKSGARNRLDLQLMQLLSTTLKTGSRAIA